MKPPRDMLAKYAGTCADCGQPIDVGAPITYRRPDAVHRACTLPATPTTTHRERLEARAEKREQWAESRATKAAARLDTADRIAGMIPMGQPILVGHHSEGRHRRDLARIDTNMRRGIEDQRAARNHEQKADGIRAGLARSIYDDDPDALDRLREKLADLEAKRDAMKAHNKEHRGGKGCHCPDDCACHSKWTPTVCGCTAHPLPSYALTNLGATIRTTRQRIARLERHAQ